MQGIVCSKIEDENELENHVCGEPSIDRMIQTAFYPHILRQQDTYCIKLMDEVIGSYAYIIKAIDFDNCDKAIAEYYETTPSFGVLYIKYLAVDQDMQKHGVGTAVLKHIMKFALQIKEDLPVRCVVFDALRNLVQFYQERGFMVFSEKEFNSDSETVKMFFDLLSEEERETIKRCYNF